MQNRKMLLRYYSYNFLNLFFLYFFHVKFHFVLLKHTIRGKQSCQLRTYKLKLRTKWNEIKLELNFITKFCLILAMQKIFSSCRLQIY